LAVHIGIATGEVIASSLGSQHHRGYTVLGEAANIALLGQYDAAGFETSTDNAGGTVVKYDPNHV